MSDNDEIDVNVESELPPETLGWAIVALTNRLETAAVGAIGPDYRLSRESFVRLAALTYDRIENRMKLAEQGYVDKANAEADEP